MLLFTNALVQGAQEGHCDIIAQPCERKGGCGNIAETCGAQIPILVIGVSDAAEEQTIAEAARLNIFVQQSECRLVGFPANLYKLYPITEGQTPCAAHIFDGEQGAADGVAGNVE